MAKRPKKTSNRDWMKNVLHSVAYTAKSLGESNAPFLANTLSSANEIRKDTADWAKRNSPFGSNKNRDPIVRKAVTQSKNLFQAAWEDIASGNFQFDKLNAKLGGSFEEFDMGFDDDGDFSFDDSDFDWGDSGDSGDDFGLGDTGGSGGSSPVINAGLSDATYLSGVKLASTATIDATKMATVQITNATMLATNAAVDKMVASNYANSVRIQQQIGNVIDHVNTMNENVASLVSFNQDAISPFLGQAQQYMENTEQTLNDIKAILETRLNPSGGGGSSSSSSKSQWYEGGLDFKKLFNKLTKDNGDMQMYIMALSGVLPIVDAMGIPLPKFIKDNPMMQMGGSVDPLGFVMKKALPSLFGRNGKNALTDLSAVIQNTVMSFLESGVLKDIPILRELHKDRGWKRATSSQYEKGATQWTGKDSKALQEVIPNYLSHIEEHVARTTDVSEMLYDLLGEATDHMNLSSQYLKLLAQYQARGGGGYGGYGGPGDGYEAPQVPDVKAVKNKRGRSYRKLMPSVKKQYAGMDLSQIPLGADGLPIMSPQEYQHFLATRDLVEDRNALKKAKYQEAKENYKRYQKEKADYDSWFIVDPITGMSSADYAPNAVPMAPAAVANPKAPKYRHLEISDDMSIIKQPKARESIRTSRESRMQNRRIFDFNAGGFTNMAKIEASIKEDFSYLETPGYDIVDYIARNFPIDPTSNVYVDTINGIMEIINEFMYGDSYRDKWNDETKVAAAILDVIDKEGGMPQLSKVRMHQLVNGLIAVLGNSKRKYNDVVNDFMISMGNNNLAHEYGLDKINAMRHNGINFTSFETRWETDKNKVKADYAKGNITEVEMKRKLEAIEKERKEANKEGSLGYDENMIFKNAEGKVVNKYRDENGKIIYSPELMEKGDPYDVIGNFQKFVGKAKRWFEVRSAESAYKNEVSGKNQLAEKAVTQLATLIRGLGHDEDVYESSYGSGNANELLNYLAGDIQPSHSYDVGAFNVQGDQIAQIHDGEMILPPDISEYIRKMFPASFAQLRRAMNSNEPNKNETITKLLDNIINAHRPRPINDAEKENEDIVHDKAVEEAKTPEELFFASLIEIRDNIARSTAIDIDQNAREIRLEAEGKDERQRSGLQQFKDLLSGALFGEKDENGHFQGGPFANIANKFVDKKKDLMAKISGQEFTDADGNVIKQEKSLKDVISEKVGAMKNSALETLYGTGWRTNPNLPKFLKDKDPDQITPESVTLAAALDSAERISEAGEKMANTAFGEDPEGDTQKASKAANDSWLDYAKRAGKGAAIGVGAAALFGGSLGTLPGMLLPTGIIGSAALGIAGGLLSKSDKFQEFLFGKKDEDGKRTGGLISENMQKRFNQILPFAVGGTALGLLKKFIAPSASLIPGPLGLMTNLFIGSGPVAGAVLGIAGGLLASSDKFKESLFGKKDAQGKVEKVGLFTKPAEAIKKFFSKSGKGAVLGAAGGLLTSLFTKNMISNIPGAGLLTGALGPAGPIGLALLGSAVGIMSQTDKFKERLFGSDVTDKDGNTHHRDGLLDKFGNMLTVNVLRPLQEFGEHGRESLVNWLKHDLGDEFKTAIAPLKDSLKDAADDVDDMFGGMPGKVFGLFNMLFHPFKKLLPKLLSLGVTASTKAIGGAAKITGDLITAPLKMWNQRNHGGLMGAFGIKQRGFLPFKNNERGEKQRMQNREFNNSRGGYLSSMLEYTFRKDKWMEKRKEFAETHDGFNNDDFLYWNKVHDRNKAKKAESGRHRDKNKENALVKKWARIDDYDSGKTLDDKTLRDRKRALVKLGIDAKSWSNQDLMQFMYKGKTPQEIADAKAKEEAEARKPVEDTAKNTAETVTKLDEILSEIRNGGKGGDASGGGEAGGSAGSSFGKYIITKRPDGTINRQTYTDKTKYMKAVESLKRRGVQFTTGDLDYVRKAQPAATPNVPGALPKVANKPSPEEKDSDGDGATDQTEANNDDLVGKQMTGFKGIFSHFFNKNKNEEKKKDQKKKADDATAESQARGGKPTVAEQIFHDVDGDMEDRKEKDEEAESGFGEIISGVLSKVLGGGLLILLASKLPWDKIITGIMNFFKETIPTTAEGIKNFLNSKHQSRDQETGELIQNDTALSGGKWAGALARTALNNVTHHGLGNLKGAAFQKMFGGAVDFFTKPGTAAKMANKMATKSIFKGPLGWIDSAGKKVGGAIGNKLFVNNADDAAEALLNKAIKAETKAMSGSPTFLTKGINLIKTALEKLAGSKAVSKIAGTKGGAMIKGAAETFAKLSDKLVSKAKGKLLAKAEKLMEKACIKAGSKTTGSAIPVIGAIMTAGDALIGAIDAAKLFYVDKKDVTAGMRVVSSLFGALLGLGPGPLLQCFNDLVADFFGIDALHNIAVTMYKIFSDDAGDLALEEKMKKLEEECAKYNEENNTNLSVKAYNDMVNEGIVSKFFGLFKRKKTVEPDPSIIPDNTDSDGYGDLDQLAGTEYDKSYSEDSYYGAMSSVLGYGPSSHFMQNDPRWGRRRFGRTRSGRETTIGTGGCGPTALANVATQLGVRTNPARVAAMARRGNMVVDGGSSAKLFNAGARQLGLKSEAIGRGSVARALRKGKKVILSGRGRDGIYTGAGHIISARGIDSRGRAIVDDPMRRGTMHVPLNRLTRNSTHSWAIGYGDFDLNDPYFDTAPLSQAEVDRIKAEAETMSKSELEKTIKSHAKDIADYDDEINELMAEDVRPDEYNDQKQAIFDLLNEVNPLKEEYQIYVDELSKRSDSEPVNATPAQIAQNKAEEEAKYSPEKALADLDNDAQHIDYAGKRYYVYGMTDPKWANTTYARLGQKIGKSGCIETAMGSVLANMTSLNYRPDIIGSSTYATGVKDWVDVLNNAKPSSLPSQFVSYDIKNGEKGGDGVKLKYYDPKAPLTTSGIYNSIKDYGGQKVSKDIERFQKQIISNPFIVWGGLMPEGYRNSRLATDTGMRLWKKGYTSDEPYFNQHAYVVIPKYDDLANYNSINDYPFMLLDPGTQFVANQTRSVTYSDLFNDAGVEKVAVYGKSDGDAPKQGALPSLSDVKEFYNKHPSAVYSTERAGATNDYVMPVTESSDSSAEGTAGTDSTGTDGEKKSGWDAIVEKLGKFFEGLAGIAGNLLTALGSKDFTYTSYYTGEQQSLIGSGAIKSEHAKYNEKYNYPSTASQIWESTSGGSSGGSYGSSNTDVPREPTLREQIVALEESLKEPGLTDRDRAPLASQLNELLQQEKAQYANMGELAKQALQGVRAKYPNGADITTYDALPTWAKTGHKIHTNSDSVMPTSTAISPADLAAVLSATGTLVSARESSGSYTSVTGDNNGYYSLGISGFSGQQAAEVFYRMADPNSGLSEEDRAIALQYAGELEKNYGYKSFGWGKERAKVYSQFLADHHDAAKNAQDALYAQNQFSFLQHILPLYDNGVLTDPRSIVPAAAMDPWAPALIQKYLQYVGNYGLVNNPHNELAAMIQSMDQWYSNPSNSKNYSDYAVSNGNGGFLKLKTSFRDKFRDMYVAMGGNSSDNIGFGDPYMGYSSYANSSYASRASSADIYTEDADIVKYNKEHPMPVKIEGFSTANIENGIGQMIILLKAILDQNSEAAMGYGGGAVSNSQAVKNAGMQTKTNAPLYAKDYNNNATDGLRTLFTKIAQTPR